jgi:adhesin transport system membrane fusion protein
LVERVLSAFETHPLLSRLTRLILPPREEDGQPTDALIGSRLTIRLLALLLGALLLWSLLFTLDIASHSTGEVTTAGQTKLSSTWKAASCAASWCARAAVKAGEPLVEVERTAAESDMRELDAQLGALQIKALRLEAQLTRKSDFKVPADLAKRFPDQVETARALLLAQKSGSAAATKPSPRRSASAAPSKPNCRPGAPTRGQAAPAAPADRDQPEAPRRGRANRYEHLNLLKKKNWPGAPSRKSTPPCAGWQRPRSRRTRPCARSTRGTTSSSRKTSPRPDARSPSSPSAGEIH